ncbi:hypothetical protein FACS1894185_3920 [Betaproteobacteria bacterium]|nr:hypothetical protein FACS1894185_3920 [Betaproteobacteria bacterium]
MAKDGLELVVNADLNQTKEIIDELMNKMDFTMSYSNSFEAIAQRGSGLASAIVGPFAGKNKVAVKFALSYRESGGKTSVLLSDSGSGFGKMITLTGGATKQVLQDVYNTLREGISRKSL